MSDIPLIELKGRRVEAERIHRGERIEARLRRDCAEADRARDALAPPPPVARGVDGNTKAWIALSAATASALPGLAYLLIVGAHWGAPPTCWLAATNCLLFTALAVGAQHQLSEQSEHGVHVGVAAFVWPVPVFALAGIAVSMIPCWSFRSPAGLAILLGLTSGLGPLFMALAAHVRAFARREAELYPTRKRASERRAQRAREALEAWLLSGKREHEEQTGRLIQVFSPRSRHEPAAVEVKPASEALGASVQTN